MTRSLKRLLCLLIGMTILLPGVASAQTAYWGMQSSRDYIGSIDYVFSVPTGSMHDFVPKVS